MPCEIVDTNVIVVANSDDGVSTACKECCRTRLAVLITNGKVAIDDCDEILHEYLNNTKPWKGNAVGDLFVKWIANEGYAHSRIHRITIVHDPARDNYETFPDDPELADFDRSDRKFVAVSRAHPESPSILQAIDSKWLNWADALRRNGVEVDFVCPDDIEEIRVRRLARP